MGIPGLSKPLKPYAVSTTVGCKTLLCSEHKPAPSESSINIIIDGPSFAYSIYHRLIVQKPEWLTAVEAMPSYEELGQGAVAFLDEMEEYGLKVKTIYFDGYLPPHKRDVRLDRLQRSLQKLSSYYTISQQLQPCKRGWDGKPLSPSVVFPSGSPTVSAFRGLPPATFVVPAVLDALGTSKYAAVTRVVPGEAEVYCAAAARESGGIILSNDSDLFVHDLGDGAFVYLDSVELRTNESKTQTDNSSSCKPLNLETFQPHSIAQRLGLQTLQSLAFQFLLHHPSTLSHAITLTKAPLSISEQLAYQTFLRDYTTSPSTSESQLFSPLALSRLRTHARFLDPRISELICQLESNNETDTANVYLLPLIEDPTRSPAWAVSAEHREFIYSVCALYLNSPTTTISECHRRAHSYTMHPISLLPLPSLLTFAHTLQRHLNLFTPPNFPNLPPPLIYRTYALFTIQLSHLTSSKKPPTHTLLQRALTATYTPHPTWNDIHLSAQIQAVLYSLRMIQQILQYISSSSSTIEPPLPYELPNLSTSLQDLPVLAKLMPLPFELREVLEREEIDIDDVMERLGVLLREEAGMGEGVGEEGDGGVTWETVGKKGKRKRKGGKEGMEGDGVGVGKGVQSNMFEVLA